MLEGTSILIDSLGKESMIPCEAELNRVFDECADSKVRLKWDNDRDTNDHEHAQASKF